MRKIYTRGMTSLIVVRGVTSRSQPATRTIIKEFLDETRKVLDPRQSSLEFNHQKRVRSN